MKWLLSYAPSIRPDVTGPQFIYFFFLFLLHISYGHFFHFYCILAHMTQKLLKRTACLIVQKI